MAKQIVEDSIWSQRLDAANKYYKEWETLFKCDILDKYYEGFQWKSQSELAYNPYTINKIYETIQIKIASFIPTFPRFTVTSKPSNEDLLEAASASANLKSDLLNTIVQEHGLNFAEEMEQAYKDHFVRFGIVEVGYEADWITNPNAPHPLLGKDAEQNLTPEKRQKIRLEPPELPQNERVFIKHIPAKTFRIGGMDHKYLNRCGWVGYYDYVHKDDLLSLPKIINRDKISAGSFRVDESERDTVGEKYKTSGIKIWKIWDFRSMQRLLIVNDPCTTVFQRKFERCPLFDIRPDKRLQVAGFYPIPPAFHWLSPQDEYNETREMLRTHRRRFIRKFQIREGMIDDEELEKFETGPDGAMVKVKQDGAIKPIDNADLGNALTESIQVSADDLNRISGTSDESRGVADRTTATQATIVNQRTALRETKDRDRVVKWYCEIGREILLVVRDNFTGQTIVRLTSPEGETFGGSVSPEKAAAFKFIKSEDLKDGYDFRIDVDLSTMSAAAAQDEKQKLLEFTAFLQQNPYVAFSPYLVREAAVRIGYRNEKAIAEFQQMSLLMELARMQQLKGALAPQQQGAPDPSGGNSQQLLQQATPPAAEQIRQQLQNMPFNGAQTQ
jgi:hypothetical protein